jgi:hypothetical protein
VRLGSRIGEILSGLISVKTVKAKRTDLYRKYLGPDWKEEWEGASTLIAAE